MKKIMFFFILLILTVTQACQKNDHAAGKQQKVLAAVEGVRKRLSDSLHTPVPVPAIHFPVLATDITLPDPRLIGTELITGHTEKFDRYNMSAQVGEGNAYGTMNAANTWILTLMTGKNVLTTATVQLMQKDFSPGASAYALGCTFMQNVGYGHNGARIGYLNLMAYDPDTGISIVSQLPLWGLRNDFTSFIKCFNAIYGAAYAARAALGYPGKP